MKLDNKTSQILIFLILTSLTACQESENIGQNEIRNISVEVNQEVSKSTRLLSKAYNAHGGANYETAHFEFTFRDKKFTFKNDGLKFVYTMDYEKEGDQIRRILKDWELEMSINGELQKLTDKQITSYSNGLNSVIYFATLPHKLNDPAVILDYAGDQTVNGDEFELLSVRFKPEGGGVDHEDEYMYWINKNSGQIDYLAYNYKVNGGGVRFRSAYNKRMIDGILFQDYINYKGEIGTELKELAILYENGELKQLSEINTEKVRSLKVQ